MEKRQQRTLQSFIRILIFMERHPVKPEPPLLTRMRTSLESSITRLRELGVEQSWRENAIAAGTVRQMRNRVRKERMMPLVRIAKPLLKFAPGSEKVMRVPHARTDSVTLATQAQRMAKLLQPHTKLLVAAGYSKSFVSEFRKEADALAKSATLMEKARIARSRATLGIKREMKKAMNTVLVIEGLLMAHYDEDLYRSSEWRMTRRVYTRIGRPPERSKRGKGGGADQASGGSAMVS